MSDSAGNASSNPSDSQSNVRDQAPLWQYVTKVDKVGTGGGNISFQCNFCYQVYTGSYSRVKCHLLKTKGGGIASCSKVTSATLFELNQVVEEAELRVKQYLPRQVPLPSANTMASGSLSNTCSIGASNYYGLQTQLPNVEREPKKRKGMEGPLEKAFNNNAREGLDSEIARMFYTGSLSFHFARNPHYVQAFTKAYNNTIAGYVPPAYNALRTTLLQKEKINIERMLGPIKSSWKEKGLKLLSIAETRFASAIIMLKRFKQIKQSLEHMVISERWDMYKEDDTEKARAVKEKILDGYFWIDMDYIINFTGPIYEMIRMADMDTPCLHLVYEWYYHDSWLEECPGRVPPHKDAGITRERKKCLERYFSNAEERRKICGEFASFSGAIEDFAGADSVEDRGFMSPMKWWLFHGASTPTLQSIALKLLGQPCSSSCCERNWNTYNFIHSMRRNKMTPQRAEDLVYVHTNLRLLSRRSPTYNEGPSQQWDVGGDGFDSMNMENSRILEIADLSLDEADLENALFNSTASGSIIVDE
ncbi:hypothetical protein JRO89_XS04G0055400 [Xanthoceras sorbifolium]|uniref:HAT C-terminal dimerisation domain-containing protein n=1 Tax=Xanthoceras sorbifolium TaxID=99658 RepID=A0ABQ8I4A6_9ROSI|nr:hypothetical protein JRO89_XS04G0055400 [Xanthoceras sorbifolium]